MATKSRRDTETDVRLNILMNHHPSIKSDPELTKRLKLSSTAIAKWRKNDAIPPKKYSLFLEVTGVTRELYEAPLSELEEKMERHFGITGDEMWNQFMKAPHVGKSKNCIRLERIQQGRMRLGRIRSEPEQDGDVFQFGEQVSIQLNIPRSRSVLPLNIFVFNEEKENSLECFCPSKNMLGRYAARVTDHKITIPSDDHIDCNSTGPQKLLLFLIYAKENAALKGILEALYKIDIIVPGELKRDIVTYLKGIQNTINKGESKLEHWEIYEFPFEVISGRLE